MSILSLRRAVSLAIAMVIALPSFAIPAREASSADVRKIIDVKSMGMFKNKKRVAVAGYQIAFVTRNKATAKAAGMLTGGSGAKASLETFLGNVDYALMQSIADQAYANFVAKLAETGMEIIPTETLRASAAFKKLETVPSSAEQAYKVEFQGAHYVIVTGGGLPLWFNKYDGLAGGKGSRKNIGTMAELSKELDAVILQPSIAIDFAYLEKEGGMLRNRASVEAQEGMLVVPAASVFWSSIDYLAYPKFLGGFWAEGATGKWVTAESASNRGLVKGLGSIGIDIGPVSSKKAIVLEADPEAFSKEALVLLDGAAELYKRGIMGVRQ